MFRTNVRVAIVGTGFGQRVQIPGFRHCEGVEIVAVCSAHREHAQAVAQRFGIPCSYDNYQRMLAEVELDLVSIATPPHLHYPMTMDALDVGVHVLCEKPMAMNLQEAREMLRRAEDAEVLHVIDHESRFHPPRRRIKELVADGYVGQLRHVIVHLVSGGRADPRRPAWSWWSESDKGGGILGALGSHQIDLLRWWFGEIEAVQGTLETFVKERPDPETGRMRSVETDDYAAFVLRFENGGHGLVLLSAVAWHGPGTHFEIYGDEGALILDHDNRLWGARRDEPALQDFSVPEPLEDVADIAPTMWARSFVRLAQALVQAIREGGPVDEAATFYDGARCQAVLDAVRTSHRLGEWVEVAAV